MKFGRHFAGKHSARIYAALLAFAVLASSGDAQTDSDPLGVVRIRLRGNSDTVVSPPLQRTPLLETRVESRSGSVLTLSGTVPALPAEGAFVLVMSGTLEGAALPVTASNGTSVTVDANGYDLAALKTEVVNGATQAALVALVPYWTLDALFPQGSGVNISPTAASRRTEILVFDDTATGTNLSASAVYFYFAGATGFPAGWYRVGGTTAVGATRLPPYRYFIVRHNIATETELTLLGGVQMAGYRLPVHTRAANRDQDNVVALPVPVPTTLAASRLIESGAFLPSSSEAARIDELLVFDNSAIGINKAPAAIYYYVSGNPNVATGWYRVGSGTTSMNNVALNPTEGCILRKRATAGATRLVWNGVPPYLQ